MIYDGVTKYHRVYALLKRYGFSPDVALEIVIDAKRKGDKAMFMIRLARTSLRPARRKTTC